MSGDEATTASRRQAGEQIVRQMFGQRFIDRNMTPPGPGPGGNEATAALMGFGLAQCYGDVWSRPELNLRDRSLVTLGLLIGLGHGDELANHVQGGLGNGLSPVELAEVAVQAAPYAGLPAAGQALRVIQTTLAAFNDPPNHAHSGPLRRTAQPDNEEHP
ncbi:carboxymuconolactone decarboxylase family protein [Streptomyces caniscabiei]|uniref:carboxymuconolactone decarboxylase family protein n=1 Tax=Streptomyces caniscabiei TaxID=2746961 RepID=UPI001C500126|nr:carboxymuconolactone decarboxylase family protein [Streptomyces caniscabiei]